MSSPHANATLQPGFILGHWTVTPNQNRIEGDAGAVHLEPKVMEVLCVLARHKGEVVSRNDLIEEVWKTTHVTDEVLSRAISVLRRQLGDDPKEPEFIATVPKSGYRLIKDVAVIREVIEVPTPTLSQSTPPSPRPRYSRKLVYGISIVILSLVTLGYFFSERTPPPPLDPRSPTLFADISDWFELIIRGDTAPDDITEIAVLPFDDISEQPGNAFLSDGLTDELIISLGQLEGLKVVARSSSLGFRNRYQDVRIIGETLNVDVVVEGTVKRADDQIRISAQLSSTRDGYVLWSHTYDRDLQDMLALQTEISDEIVSALREKLDLTDLQSPVTPAASPDMEAYQLYLNGRFLWKLRGDSPLRKSIELFEKALQLDPGFTRAQLALANSLLLLPSYSSEDEEHAISRALTILEGVTAMTASEAGEAEAIKGFIAFRRWQWQLAEEQYHKALLLAPNNPNLYVWYSQLLSAVGRNVDALKTAQQARDLDSVSPVINDRLAVAWLWNNDNVRAAEQFVRGAELGFNNQRNAGYLIFLLRMQRFDEARQVIKNLYAGSGADPQWLMDNIQAISQGAAGEDLIDAAVAAIDRGDVSPRVSLGLWLYLNEPGRVYDVVQGSVSLKRQLDFELLFSAEAREFRNSDEFSDLAEELGLESYWENWKGPDEE